MSSTLRKEEEIVVPTTRLETEGTENNTTMNIVDFDGLDDPKDPVNWSNPYKWSMVVLISLLSLIV